MSRRASMLRWLIFGVGLPLLPILGNIAAHWIDDQTSGLSYSGIFGDGDLLVLATVVSAAGIGDLVFDIRQHGRARTLKDAVAISLALLVVVIAVLLFGIVELEKESGGALKTTANQSATALSAEAASLQQQAANARSQAAFLLEQLNSDTTGTDGEAPGVGPNAQFLQQQYVAAIAQANQLSEQANTVSQGVARANQQSANAGSEASSRAATASVVMFVISLLAGGGCVVVGSTDITERVNAPAT